ncbi:MAG: hypothetical protein NZ585_01765, partial [Chloracidobacterium sp.]|nr:hypothetical protein [Chloracidobacterium sp.]
RWFRHDGARYVEERPAGERLWVGEAGLFVGAWRGEYEGRRGLWLRFYDADGALIPTKAEREALEREAKERERQAKEAALRQAEQERQAKEAALQAVEQERAAKERERAAKERERKAKEAALRQAEQERQAKEAALQELERLKAKLRDLNRAE